MVIRMPKVKNTPDDDDNDNDNNNMTQEDAKCRKFVPVYVCT